MADVNVRLTVITKQAVDALKKVGLTAAKTAKNISNSFKTSTKSLAKFTKGARNAGKQIQGLKNSFFNLKTAIGGAAAAFGLFKIGQFVNEAILGITRLGDETAKTADKLGVGIEALQELRFAAERAGIGAQTFDTALQRFTRRAAEAANGTGEAKDALRQLGVTLKDANGNLRPAEELLGDVADSFSKIPSQAEKVRLAFKLFDTEGVQLVNLLNEGKIGLEEFRKRAQELGFVIGAETARQAEKFSDALTDLNKSFQGLRVGIVSDLLPGITAFAEELTNVIIEFKAVDKAVRENAVREAFLDVFDAGVTVVKVFDAIFRAGKGLIAIFDLLVNSIVTGLKVIVGIVPIIVSEFGRGIGFIIEKFSKLLRFIPLIGKELSNLFGRFGRGVKSVGKISDAIGDSITDSASKTSNAIANIEDAFGKPTQAFLNFDKIAERLRDSARVGFLGIEKGAEKSKKKNDGLNKSLGNTTNKIEELRKKIIESSKNPIQFVVDVLVKGQQADPNSTVGAVAGGIAAIGQGAQGASQILGSFVSSMAETIIPGLGGVAGQIFELLAAGPEAVEQFVIAFIDAIPTIVENIALAIPRLITVLVERIPILIQKLVAAIPRVITEFIRQLPRLILGLIALLPRVVTSLITGIIAALPELFKAFTVELLKSAKAFVEALIDEVKGGFGLFDGGGFLGLASGGVISGGVPGRDSVPAILTPGERVLTVRENNDFENFLRAQSAQQPASTDMGQTNALLAELITTQRSQQTAVNVSIGDEEIFEAVRRQSETGRTIA